MEFASRNEREAVLKKFEPKNLGLKALVAQLFLLDAQRLLSNSALFQREYTFCIEDENFLRVARLASIYERTFT